MHELVIRGGNLVDGTGSPARVADVGIDHGLIAAVGNGLRGRREVDAQGLLVTPGFVDIHTHYDGQALWDAHMTPSSWHGVTTVVFGNCGVGFAPVRPQDVPYLVDLMRGVEDIPEAVLMEGIAFTWESFPQYLDRLEAMPRSIDVGAQVPHCALRFYVMGERGADYREQPTPDEISRMSVLLEEALRAGALGLTTSRMSRHRAGDGRYIPSLTASSDELLGLAAAMRRAGSGVIEVNSEWGPGEFDLMASMARAAGRPLSCLLIQFDTEPQAWRDALAAIHAARARGIDVNAQVGCRPIGVLMGFETTINPFAAHPRWQALMHLTPAQRYERLAADPGLRRVLIDEEVTDPVLGRIIDKMGKAHVLGVQVDYEPRAEHSVAALARQRGVSLREVAFDAMMAEAGRGMLLLPHENYAEGNLDAVREMLLDEATVMGLSDAGAHVGSICDAGSPTLLLTHWARDRTRGPRLPIEWLVHKQTAATAAAYGLHDRGVIAPGRKADLNVIDFDRLRMLAPELVYDMPAGGRRLIQKAEGYRHVFVSGVETIRDDTPTGRLPGRLVRGTAAHARVDQPRDPPVAAC